MNNQFFCGKEVIKYTGPIYSEFGYNEHLAITGIFSPRKEHFWMTSMLKKFGTTNTTYNEQVYVNQFTRYKRYQV